MKYRAYRIDDVWHAGTSQNNGEFKCAARFLAERLVKKLNEIEKIIADYFKELDQTFVLNEHVVATQTKVLRKVLRENLV